MNVARRYTWADVERLPHVEGTRYEIIAGELHVASQPSLEHQYACTGVIIAVEGWSRRTGLGVTVQAPGAIPGPGPAPPQPVAADKTAPALKLGGRGNQKVLRQRSVAVVVEADEASTVVARGTISVPGSGRTIRLRKASKQVAAGAKVKLALRLSRPKLRSLRRAFQKRPRLTARVTATGTDQAGNRRSAKRTVKVLG